MIIHSIINSKPQATLGAFRQPYFVLHR